MKLTPLKQLKKWSSPTELYQYCKRIVQEKENYAKIRVQKAQQFIDEFLTTGTIVL